MDYTRLGRTGLAVSVAGLGCGGSSRLGQAAGASAEQSVALVRHCLDLGVTLIDTAAAYGTEEIVGAALAAVPRDRVVVSTKARPARGGTRLDGAGVVEALHQSLRRLRLDTVDVFHLHAVRPDEYDWCRDEILPALLAERDKGSLRFIGITETPPNDPEQRMLARALDDDVWDVMMIGYHMLNQRPAGRVLQRARDRAIGTLIMFAVRAIFSVPGRLGETVERLIAEGRLAAAGIDRQDPLGFLVHPGGATSVIDAAYRFVRHTPGVDVTLFGTGSRDHAAANIQSILAPPLPAADRDRLAALFGHLEGVGLDLPTR